MTEESLHMLSINDLLALLMKNVSELFVMQHKKDDEKDIQEKQKYVELVQRVCVVRRAEFPPELTKHLSIRHPGKRVLFRWE